MDILGLVIIIYSEHKVQVKCFLGLQNPIIVLMNADNLPEQTEEGFLFVFCFQECEAEHQVFL